MKKLALLIWILLVHTACETGTKYDTNKTTDHESERGLDESFYEEDIEEDPTHSDSYYIDQGEDNYAEELSLVESQPEEIEESSIPAEEPAEEEETVASSSQHFEGGIEKDGLDIVKIRKANHDDYVRLVFDSKGSSKVGGYSIDYYPEKSMIVIQLGGYKKFSAKFPAFEKNSIIEKIDFSKYQESDGGYKLYIKLREDTKMTAFALDTPARLVIDVKKP